MKQMAMMKLLIGATLFVVLAGCGGSAGTTDDRTAIIDACNTQQGAGWLRKEYGENYCECYADTAQQKLDSDSYRTLAAASREELKAADDEAARETIARRNTGVYSEASHHAQSCKRT
ncbi:MAG TPA: hypothetical protein PKL49_04675 [Steroidobacteraceae bacterium]|nr:hypothetical protein [Steroidobacteraceae bacterium]